MKKILYILMLLLIILVYGCQKEHIHIYEETIIYETCTTDGQITYTCECGFSYIEKREAIGHKFGEWITEREPSCAEAGLRTRTCEACSYSQKNETTKYEHPHENTLIFDDEYHWYEPTCEHTQEKVGKALHNYSNYNICVDCGHQISGTKGLTYKLTEDKSGYMVTGYGEVTLDEITIPSKHGQLNVIGIAKGAFNANFNLININLPNTIQFIEEKAFANCINLLEIFLIEGIKVIKSETFVNCYKLVNISIKEGTEIIESNAFEDCYALKYIVIPKSVKEIKENAFINCESVYKIYYTGTQEDWDKMIIDSSNISIINAIKSVVQ